MESLRKHGAGAVLVLSAPSGAGKSTVAQALMKRVQGLRFSISYTTRNRREGEVHEVDYHFVDAERFRSMREAGEFLEWAEVHGHHYGTARGPVQAILDAGDDVLLDVDVKGAVAVQQALPEAVLVFLLPPSYQELQGRLQGRGTPGDDVSRRLRNARDEMDRVDRFDYLVVNEVLDEATLALEAILLAERSRRERRTDTWRRIRATFPD